MDAISSAEIADARAELATMLQDTCSIGRFAQSSDGGGGQIDSWSTVASGVPCRLQRLRVRSAGVIEVVASREVDETTHMVAFAAGTDVRVKDHVTIGSTSYEVLLVRTAGSWEFVRHVEVRMVAP